jgi:hypothetical protein
LSGVVRAGPGRSFGLVGRLAERNG